MNRTQSIDIENAIISITKIKDEDYICLTDMAKANYHIQTDAVQNHILHEKNY